MTLVSYWTEVLTFRFDECDLIQITVLNASCYSKTTWRHVRAACMELKFLFGFDEAKTLAALHYAVEMQQAGIRSRSAFENVTETITASVFSY